MDLKVVKNIDNNIFSVSITIDAYGTDQLSEDEEKELLLNFPVKLAYRNLTFSRNIKMEGSVPVITEDDPEVIPEEGVKTVSETITTVNNGLVKITLPPLSNKEIPIDDNFNAYYKIDYTKIPSGLIDGTIITTKEIMAQAYCEIFADVICKAVQKIMIEVRSKAPAFEGETIVSV